METTYLWPAWGILLGGRTPDALFAIGGLRLRHLNIFALSADAPAAASPSCRGWLFTFRICKSARCRSLASTSDKHEVLTRILFQKALLRSMSSLNEVTLYALDLQESCIMEGCPSRRVHVPEITWYSIRVTSERVVVLHKLKQQLLHRRSTFTP